ncbi:hypothetical protein FIE12Z_1803 [Fusarium flagelliforme]|uniref:Clr5 domain-containing protein n=1 Tax=Fusarium flagelliforme TaxID=2675880 RepID=A0A395N2T5_9HYPO|nr:hypothetical protein FIE12Z_1803 [Fusarium flagelliforme]
MSQSDDRRYLRLSHDEQWNHLKPVIIKLYTGNYGKNNKPLKIPQIVSFMKEYYYFWAAENTYPHKFRKWGVSDRRLTKAMVNEIAAALGRRSRAGMSTSRITLKRGPDEQALDLKQVKRHLGDSSSSARPEIIQSGWLSSWPLPYAAFVSVLPKIPDAASPYGTQAATPGYLRINESDATSPQGEVVGPSPNMQLLLQKARDDRTSLFLQGRLKDLIVSMSQDDRRICVDYLHEHGFITAKNWGSPRSIVDIPTPPAFTPSAFLQYPSSPLLSDSPSRAKPINPPTSLCRWCIHVKDVRYQPLPNQPADTDTTPTPFADSLHTAIASGEFTELRNDSLPLSHETIVESLTENPIALHLDAWKLAIMAGNSDLLFDLCKYYDEDEDFPDEIKTIYPHHLAASFLNGGGPCCTVFGTLADLCPRSFLIRHNVNELGHTILDSLLVSVLRSYTSVRPETVSHEFGALSRFPGEEKDMCGRWDADSPDVRELFAQGYARVPTRWKHPFCHSAVQAVCHCAMVVFGTKSSADINCLSGLFLRRCPECGMELKLGPIHALVVTAFFLVQSGLVGETLFGPIAILLCLMSMGVDVTMRANVSVEEIIGSSGTGHCRHRALTAAELMQSVPASVVESWRDACQTGWDALLHTLIMGDPHLFDEDDHSQICGLSEWFHEDTNMKCTNKMIGVLWATIQAEFLAYRRTKVNDPWISDNFQMDALRAWLRDETEDFDTPLVSEGMLNVHSKCGWFLDKHRYGDIFATASDVCAEWFANMDDYKRATFVHAPDLRALWFYD